jgi:hypothetical protein
MAEEPAGTLEGVRQALKDLDNATMMGKQQAAGKLVAEVLYLLERHDRRLGDLEALAEQLQEDQGGGDAAQS